MSQIFAPGRNHDDDDQNGGGQAQIDVQPIDDLLDEVDDLLSRDAETFVNSFVQKGGQ